MCIICKDIENRRPYFNVEQPAITSRHNHQLIAGNNIQTCKCETSFCERCDYLYKRDNYPSDWGEDLWETEDSCKKCINMMSYYRSRTMYDAETCLQYCRHCIKEGLPYLPTVGKYGKYLERCIHKK